MKTIPIAVRLTEATINKLLHALEIDGHKPNTKSEMMIQAINLYIQKTDHTLTTSEHLEPNSQLSNIIPTKHTKPTTPDSQPQDKINYNMAPIIQTFPLHHRDKVKRIWASLQQGYLTFEEQLSSNDPFIAVTTAILLQDSTLLNRPEYFNLKPKVTSILNLNDPQEVYK